MEITFRKEIKKTIKFLEETVEDIDGMCTFWACEGHEKMIIKNMITCRVCATVIRSKRKIERINKSEAMNKLDKHLN